MKTWVIVGISVAVVVLVVIAFLTNVCFKVESGDGIPPTPQVIEQAVADTGDYFISDSV